MLTSSASFGENQLQLQSAVLIYGSPVYGHNQPSATHATFHSVARQDSAPVILPGRLATEDDLVALTRGLALSRDVGGATWVEPNMLAQGGGRMIWYTPAGKRAMFFKCAKLEASGIAPVPALVWMTYGSDLYVYALQGDGRPEQTSKLCQAPFFNVWSYGRVCVGSARMPGRDEAANPLAWEKGFFESNFTHPNFAQKDRLINGMEPHSFWKKMMAKPPALFPKKRLVELPVTVQDLLDPALETTLSSIGRALGEF